MIIDKSSWHYRFMSKFAPSPVSWYSNLCSYMRVLIGTLILVTFLLPSLLYGMGEAVALVFMGKDWIKEIWFVYLAQSGGWILPLHGFISLLAGGFAWIIVCVGLLAAGIDAIRYKIEAKKVKRIDEGYEPQPPKESVFKAWWRALHDKTCPMLEFKD